MKRYNSSSTQYPYIDEREDGQLVLYSDYEEFRKKTCNLWLEYKELMSSPPSIQGFAQFSDLLDRFEQHIGLKP